MSSKLTLRESFRGFPIWQMLVVCLIRFSEPITFTSLFPYVYFMIRDFGVVEDEAKISAYTGYLSAAFAFFQFLLCVQWSRFSDRVGRKPILLCGLFGTTLSMLLFGFLSNFYVALFARSCMGAVNGNIAVLRTMIGEIATQRKHQAVAFSTLPLLWNLGSVIGPLIGGSRYLTRPKLSPGSDVHESGLKKVYELFLDTYPYALSNVVVATFLVFSMVVGFLFLEETHYRLKRKRDIGLDIGDRIRRFCGYETPERPWHRRRNGESRVKTKHLAHPFDTDELPEVHPLLASETDALLESASAEDSLYSNDEESSLAHTAPIPLGPDSNSVDSEASVGLMTRRMSLAFIRRFSSNPSIGFNLSRSTSIASISDCEGPGSTSRFDSNTFTKPVIMAILANFLLSFQSLVFSEFLPILLAGEFMKDKLKFPITITGGFGWNSNTIGTLLSTTGFVGVIVVMFVFPIMDRHLKSNVGFRISSYVFPFVYFLLPFVIFTLHDYDPRFPPWFAKLLIYGLSAICALASATAFPQLVILIHRASLPQHRALINGTTLSLSSLARCIAPLSWGWLISFCNSYLLGGLSWWLLALMATVSCVQASMMEEHNEDLISGEVS